MSKKSLTKDVEALKSYNVLDCIYTARVYAQLRQDLKDEGPRAQALYEQHLELARIAAEMHDTGWPVNEENRQWLAWFLREKLTQERERVVRLVNIPGFRATPDDLRALIFKRHETPKIHRFGLDDPYDKRMWTEGGKISVSQDSLLLLMTQTFVPPELVEIIDCYWEAAGAQKELGTFVESKRVLEAIGSDGRMRPSWNTCGTDTGRWSCSQPNMMNLPQLLRHMYAAPPGHVIVHADKSQLELRVMAAVSGDKQLAANLATGDVYTQDAIAIFNLPRDTTKDTCKKAARRQGKIGHLGFQYGAGTATLYAQFLAADRKIRYSHVDMVHRKLKSLYAGTVAYWDREQARVEAAGYSETRLMRRRRIYPRIPAITDTSNFPIQGTAADIMNKETIELDRMLKKYVPSAKMAGQLHDALDVFSPYRHQGEVLRIVEDVLGGQEYEIEGQKWAFGIETKISDNWADV